MLVGQHFANFMSCKSTGLIAKNKKIEKIILGGKSVAFFSDLIVLNRQRLTISTRSTHSKEEATQDDNKRNEQVSRWALVTSDVNDSHRHAMMRSLGEGVKASELERGGGGRRGKRRQRVSRDTAECFPPQLQGGLWARRDSGTQPQGKRNNHHSFPFWMHQPFFFFYSALLFLQFFFGGVDGGKVQHSMSCMSADTTRHFFSEGIAVGINIKITQLYPSEGCGHFVRCRPLLSAEIDAKVPSGSHCEHRGTPIRGLLSRKERKAVSIVVFSSIAFELCVSVKLVWVSIKLARAINIHWLLAPDTFWSYF